MPEVDVLVPKKYRPEVPQVGPAYDLRGASSYDWGMKNRLGRIFRQPSNRTVMLAVDHGYFQGPTTGLERIDLAIPPLLDHADALMCTRGTLRATVTPTAGLPIVLRASGGPSVLRDLSDERIALAMDDAVRLNAAAVAVQLFVGSEHETESIHHLTELVDSGMRVGIPVVGVVAVGRELVRDARYFRLACRMAAELGAQVVKCYYTAEDFETVTASCPVPIVVAGGKKLDERDALEMAHHAVAEGAGGVDMGRNIFQSDSPVGMIRAIRAVVHDGASVSDAYDIYLSARQAESVAV